MNANNIDQLESILQKTATLIADVKPHQLLLPTPCPDYNVETLIKHMVSWLNKFALEETNPGTTVDPSVYTFNDDLVADFRRDAEALIAARRRQLPALAPAMGMNMIEYIVHGWDLAVATGQTVAYSDQESAAALAFGQGMMKPEYRGEDQVFGHEVPAPKDATETEKLVAFMGRRPDWTPSN